MHLTTDLLDIVCHHFKSSNVIVIIVYILELWMKMHFVRSQWPLDIKFQSVHHWVIVDICTSSDLISSKVFLRYCIHENGAPWGHNNLWPLATKSPSEHLDQILRNSRKPFLKYWVYKNGMDRCTDNPKIQYLKPLLSPAQGYNEQKKAHLVVAANVGSKATEKSGSWVLLWTTQLWGGRSDVIIQFVPKVGAQPRPRASVKPKGL